MNLSQLIEQLGQLYVQHGDLPVLWSAPHSSQVEVDNISVDNGYVTMHPKDARYTSKAKYSYNIVTNATTMSTCVVKIEP